MDVKATRMGLLLTKKKLKLASKGHKLLKEKRDALISEFFKALKEIKGLRKELGNSLAQAQDSLYKAQAIQGETDVARLSLGVSTGTEVEFESKKIMSVSIPEIKNISIKEDWFGYYESTVELDNAVKKYRTLFPTLIKLSAKQLALQKLAEEIKSTKRKVNSLEYLIIPDLEKTKKMIAFKLEEQERENFTRLKKLKERAS